MKTAKILILMLLVGVFPGGDLLDACSIFTASDQHGVLVGNNEDTTLTDARIAFTPASDKKYGKMVFIFDSFLNGFPQGGMNTAGLFFDITATPKSQVVVPPEITLAACHSLMEKILAECATVEEALAMANKYNFASLQIVQVAQIFFADKTGDAAILGAGKDNQLHITRKSDKFLVLTNFNVANPQAGCYPCYRHSLASDMLQENPQPTVVNFRGILSAVHTEGPATTVYSDICDLKNGVVYLYYFHNFEVVVTINLEEELKKGAYTVTLDALFPRKPFAVIVTKELLETFQKLLKNQKSQR